MQRQQKPSVDVPSSTVPQWKLDFLAKKQALKDYQRKLGERTLGQCRIQEPTVTTSHPEADTACNRGSSTFLITDYASESIVSSISEDKHKLDATNNSSQLVEANIGKVSNNRQSSVLSNGLETADMDHDDQLANTEEDNSETDTDSNSSVEDKASSGKTGGYSFLTGQRIAVHTCDTNESSSSDEGESNETESETEGSTELKYKPGFVSKLLNKFSTISYQGSVVGSSVPSSARHNMIRNKSSAPNEVTSIISPSQTSSCTSDQSVNLPSPQTSNTNDMVSPNSIISPVDNYDPPALKAQPIRSSVGLPRKTFYRAPNEIILIEGHSGSDGIAASPADDHLEEVRSPTQSPAEKSPEQAEANE